MVIHLSAKTIIEKIKFEIFKSVIIPRNRNERRDNDGLIPNVDLKWNWLTDKWIELGMGIVA